VVLTLTTTTSADVLWDQSNYIAGESIMEHEFTDAVEMNTYVVTDVISTGWVVDSVSTYFTSFAGDWNGVTEARLNVFSFVREAPLPLSSDDPTTGTVVPVTMTEMGDQTWKVTASGLDLDLPAGAYWVGLTPLAGTITENRQEFRVAAPKIGYESAFRNPGGVFGFTDWYYVHAFGGEWPNYDPAILIEGVPEPATASLLALGALAVLRRRR
jgi:hypothetical protein